jgi:transposase
MSSEESYINERLDHLGIVAGVCQEIGLAAWLDAQDPTHRQQVSVGTATVAMILNGLGFSNRQLYLVPQYFANKPVEHLLGAGIRAEMLNDDCLGRTLDWLYAHDPTRLFAGIARQARQMFGVKVKPGACGHHLVFREWAVRANDCGCAGRANRGGAGDHCHHVWLFARPP